MRLIPVALALVALGLVAAACTGAPPQAQAPPSAQVGANASLDAQLAALNQDLNALDSMQSNLTLENVSLS